MPFKPISADEMMPRYQEGGMKPPAGSGFSDVLDSISPAAVEATAQYASPETASVTNAALTGVLTSASANGPYGQGMAMQASPFSPTGYSTPSAEVLGSGYGGTDYSYAGGSYGTGAAGGLPTDPFLQQNFLLDKMRTTNMEMIALQSQVQTIGREFMVISNILSAKDRAQRNSIQNIRG